MRIMSVLLALLDQVKQEFYPVTCVRVESARWQVGVDDDDDDISLIEFFCHDCKDDDLFNCC